MPHAYFALPRPLVLGHRGAAGSAPENTLPAFERGLQLGADILESDVQTTSDGIPVLLHDARVDRTTDAEGECAEISFERLRGLDAAHHFEQPAGRFPYRGRGIRIPSLAQAFDALPQARFNLEIKTPDARAIGEVVRLVREYAREERTLLTAGEDDIMSRLRAEVERAGIRPALGASAADVLGVVRSALDATPPAEGVMALQIPRQFGGRPLVTPELIAHCHAHEIQIHVWTINEPDEMRELLELGVDGLVTDRPERLVALIREARG